jgi:predicted hydrocarbon binding protein
MAALTAAIARRVGVSDQELLERFGEQITPTLMARYHQYFKPAWKTLDVIEHTEEHIHRAVRVRDPGAAPPELEARRVSPGEVVVIYRSRRRMCGFARGIARGVARHFGETVVINDLTCMLNGKPACTISVTLAAPLDSSA